MSPSTANSPRGGQTSADFCAVSPLLFLMQWSRWIWSRDYRRTTKAKYRRMDDISASTGTVSIPLSSYVFDISPVRYPSISAILNKAILDFLLPLISAFPLPAHPAASPATLMVFPPIKHFIKSKFQCWINLPELMRWVAHDAINQRAVRWLCPVGSYDIIKVHLGAQLSSNGSKSLKLQPFSVYPS